MVPVLPLLFSADQITGHTLPRNLRTTSTELFAVVLVMYTSDILNRQYDGNVAIIFTRQCNVRTLQSSKQSEEGYSVISLLQTFTRTVHSQWIYCEWVLFMCYFTPQY